MQMTSHVWHKEIGKYTQGMRVVIEGETGKKQGTKGQRGLLSCSLYHKVSDKGNKIRCKGHITKGIKHKAKWLKVKVE